MMVSVRFTIRDIVDKCLTTDYWIDAVYVQPLNGEWRLLRGVIEDIVLWFGGSGHVAQVPHILATHWLKTLGYDDVERGVLIAARDPDSEDIRVRLIDLILKAAEDDAEYRERRRAAAEHVTPDAEDADYERIRNGDVPTPLRLRPEWNK